MDGKGYEEKHEREALAMNRLTLPDWLTKKVNEMKRQMSMELSLEFCKHDTWDKLKTLKGLDILLYLASCEAEYQLMRERMEHRLAEEKR